MKNTDAVLAKGVKHMDTCEAGVHMQWDRMFSTVSSIGCSSSDALGTASAYIRSPTKP